MGVNHSTVLRFKEAHIRVVCKTLGLSLVSIYFGVIQFFPDNTDGESEPLVSMRFIVTY